MRPISILTAEGGVLADRAFATSTWLERLRGWIGKTEALPGEGLLLAPASSIHTFGIRFSLDLVFVDARGVVVKLCPHLKPNRIALAPALTWLTRQGMQALELPAGTLAAVGLRLGETVRIRGREEGAKDA